jgi:hypothetical protein
MKTPYGRECRYFYGDYYRGRNFEECRLIQSKEDGRKWEPILCKNCPVPAILANNGCPHMVLSATIKNFLGHKSVRVDAYCTKSHQTVKDPNVGCDVCHSQ